MTIFSRICSFFFCCFRRRGYRPIVSKRCSINDMPDDLLMEIFSYLPKDNPNNQYKKMCEVSRRWKDLIESRITFDQNWFFDYNYSNDLYSVAANSNRKYKKIFIWVDARTEEQIPTFIRSVEKCGDKLNEVQMSFRNSFIKDNKQIERLWKCIKDVRFIHFTSTNKLEYADPNHWWGVIFCNVRHLKLHIGYFERFLDCLRFPYLEKLEIQCIMDCEQLLRVFYLITRCGSCNRLRHLSMEDSQMFRFEFSWINNVLTIHNFRWCDKIADQVLEFLARRLEFLEKLNINQKNLPDKLLKALFKYTPKLQTIVTDFIFDRELFLIMEPNLTVKRLYLLNYYATQANLDALVRILPNLESLHVQSMQAVSVEKQEKIRRAFPYLGYFSCTGINTIGRYYTPW